MRIFSSQGVTPEMIERAWDWSRLAREIEGRVASQIVRDARRAGWDGTPATIALAWRVETREPQARGDVYDTSAWAPDRLLPARVSKILCCAEMTY